VGDTSTLQTEARPSRRSFMQKKVTYPSKTGGFWHQRGVRPKQEKGPHLQGFLTREGGNGGMELGTKVSRMGQHSPSLTIIKAQEWYRMYSIGRRLKLGANLGKCID